MDNEIFSYVSRAIYSRDELLQRNEINSVILDFSVFCRSMFSTPRGITNSPQ